MNAKKLADLKTALTQDPHTHTLAEALEMSVADYVALVVHFASTPAQPQFFVVPEARLRAVGEQVLSEQQVVRYFNERSAAAKAVGGTVFEPARRRLVAL